MKATCQCGSLAAEIRDDANPMTVMCHCRACQKRSGSPFGVVAYYVVEDVKISGFAQEFTRQTDLGNSFTSGFCPSCGSTVYAKASKYPAMIGVTTGTITDPAFPSPARSVFEQSRHEWVIIPDTMPRHPRGRNS